MRRPRGRPSRGRSRGRTLAGGPSGASAPAAAGERHPLAGGRAAAVAADDLVLEPEPLEDADRLAVLARRDLDLVAARAQALDHRAQDERMRRGGAIDPDPHQRAETYGPGAGGLTGGGSQRLQGRSEVSKDKACNGVAARLRLARTALAGAAGRGRRPGRGARRAPRLALQGKNSVKANDIANDAVKGKEIADRCDQARRPRPDQGRRRGRPAADRVGPGDRPRRPLGQRSPCPRRAGRDLRARHRARSTAATRTRSPRCTCSSRSCSRARRRILEFNAPEPQLRITTPGPGTWTGPPR